MSKLGTMTVKSVLRDGARWMMQQRYRAVAHPKVFDWNWQEKGYNRIALVTYLVQKARGWDTDYLEIGCASNSLFHSVPAHNKVGVDPARGGTHRMTSDAFFAQNTQQFDVVFVDGLHEYQQVRRDALHALKCLKTGGWVAFHDFLPVSWKEHHVPRLQSSWTGDCWKHAVELSHASGIELKILEIDHGVGLIRKVSDTFEVPDMSAELAAAEFDRFVSEVERLPIVSFDEAIAYIDGATG